jgi:hypothetical protein
MKWIRLRAGQHEFGHVVFGVGHKGVAGFSGGIDRGVETAEGEGTAGEVKHVSRSRFALKCGRPGSPGTRPDSRQIRGNRRGFRRCDPAGYPGEYGPHRGCAILRIPTGCGHRHGAQVGFFGVVFGVPGQVVLPEEVGPQKARHVDGILRRTKGRRVGQFQVFQVVDGHPRPKGRSQDINAFVDAIEADHLGTQEFAVFGGKQHLEVHGRGAGVVGGVARGMQVHLAVGLLACRSIRSEAPVPPPTMSNSLTMAVPWVEL